MRGNQTVTPQVQTQSQITLLPRRFSVGDTATSSPDFFPCRSYIYSLVSWIRDVRNYLGPGYGNQDRGSRTDTTALRPDGTTRRDGGEQIGTVSRYVPVNVREVVP